jgi:hypothetical protein
MAAAGTAAGVVLEACQFCVGVRRGPVGRLVCWACRIPPYRRDRPACWAASWNLRQPSVTGCGRRVARLGLRRSGGDRHESKIDNQPTPDRNPYLPSAVLLPVEEAAQHRRDKQADHRQ